MAKVIIIGIDGGTWTIIKPLAESGKLPTFKKLIENGSWGVLESTIPPVTGPAWVSFVTGKNPGKHGVFDFVYLDNGYLRLHTSQEIKALTFYDILSKKKMKSIIIGLPLSFPPKKGFRGVMLSDFLYPQKDIYPPDKKEYLRKYKVFSDVSKTGKRALEDIIQTAKSRIKVAKELILNEEWDLYFLWFGETDTMAHLFLDELLAKEDNKAKKVLKILDDFLGWLLKNFNFNEKIYLFLVSDHGFKKYLIRFYLNTFLYKKGYIKYITSHANNETHIIRVFQNINKQQKHVKIPEALFKFITHPFVLPFSRIVYEKLKLFLGKEITIKVDKEIDFRSSKAFVPTRESYGIYIQAQDKQKELIILDLIKTLEDLEYRGEKVFNKIYRKEEIYWGEYIDLAPEILLFSEKFIIMPNYSNTIFEERPYYFHDLKGIFLAYGPGIKKGYHVNAKIYDVAPTILHIFGLPIPNNMDGRVLMEIFEPDSEFAKRKPRYVDPSYYEKKSEDEKLKKAIKELKLKGKI